MFLQLSVVQFLAANYVLLSLRSKSKLLCDCQSISMPWYRAPLWECDRILLPVGMLLSKICGRFCVARSLMKRQVCLLLVFLLWLRADRSGSYFMTVSQSVRLGIEYTTNTSPYTVIYSIVAMDTCLQHCCHECPIRKHCILYFFRQYILPK
jgi:hypothetical protein